MTGKHIVLHTANFWGHKKPIISFAARVLEMRPEAIVTVLTSAILYTKVVEEFARIAPPTSHFRVVDICGIPAAPEAPMLEFDDAFAVLWEAKPLTCRSSGKVLDVAPRPSTAVIDPFAFTAFEAVRRISNDICHLSSWTCVASPPILRAIGLGDIKPAFQAKLASGMDVLKASEEVWFQPKGEVQTIQGLPPVFDYEWFPQEDHFPHAVVAQHVYPSLILAHTNLFVAIVDVDAGSAEALKEWFKAKNKTAWLIGPLSAPTITSKAVDTAVKPGNEVVAFLDRMQVEHGTESVIFISFGTFFWPVNLDYLWAFLDELITAKTPFVLAHASPNAVIPPERKKAILDSGLGIATPWAPQEVVLAHPATQAFVTHGGWNSTQEAIIARVPLIFWPFGADQPDNAALIGLVHKAAFELLSVRTGPGAQLPYRCRDGPSPEFSVEGVRRETRQLLERLHGEEGQQVRNNLNRLADMVDRAWEEKGTARREMEEFLKGYFD